MQAIGIDLGTTNSVLAYSEIENGKIKTKVIEIERLDIRPGHRVYTQKREKLLPSVAYYDASENSWIVGDGAQKRFQEKPASVAKSVKRHMDSGEKNLSPISHISWTPIQVSTEILRQLINGMLYMYRYITRPDSLVITVPASFETSMINATITAAENAGLEITKEDLLYEPHAALYQFFHTPHVKNIDLSLEKMFLVFDLGGGTLDVSLHEVSKQDNYVTIKDIAISPYTRFGGDDFDKRVARFLLNKYSPYKSSSKAADKKILKSQFQEYAKEAKEALNPVVTRHPIRKTPKDSEDKSLKAFVHDLELSEYEDIVEPLLAFSLDLKSCRSKGQNIINPILYVLDEGKKKLNLCERPNVDVVLLNGGMTRLEIIRKRLEDFFINGYIIPEAELDPQTAVAEGAAIYCLRGSYASRRPICFKVPV